MIKPLFTMAAAMAACAVFGQAVPAKPAATPAEDASAFMKRVSDKISGHTSARGSLELKSKAAAAGQQGQTIDISFKVMKPNFISMSLPEFEIHGNGTDLIMYSSQEKVYKKLTPDMLKQGGPTSLLIGLDGLFNGQNTPFQPQGKVKPGFFRGIKATVVQLAGGGSDGPIWLYVDADSLAPIAFTSPDGQNTAIYKDLTFDAPMKAEDFAWSPPADAKSMDAPPVPVPAPAPATPPATGGKPPR